jgi:glycosyltransferase involved in cell wall biosynthesis
LTFVYAPTSERERRLSRVPGLYYLAYRRWHCRAFEIIKRLHNDVRFDLVHHVNLCGFREPGYAWQLDVPFIWGPVGGAQNYPWRFLRSAGLKGALSETLRSWLNSLQVRFSPRVGKAARKAAVVLAANSTNASALEPRRGKPIDVMLETGVHPLAATPVKNFRHAGPLRILWSGVFEHRKALHLLLEAISRFPANVPFELKILGRGPMNNRWRWLAKRLNVDDRCQWLGWINHEDVAELYRWADVFVFSSLRDTSGNVVLESFANGTPVICLDHQGVADMVTQDCGVKLTVTTHREVVNGMRNALVYLHKQRDELERLSRGALARAEHYSWWRQGRRMAEIYRQVLGERAATVDRSAERDSPAENAGRELVAGAELA